MYIELHGKGESDDSSAAGSNDDSFTSNIDTSNANSSSNPKNKNDNTNKAVIENDTDSDVEGGDDDSDAMGKETSSVAEIDVKVPTSYIFPSFMAFVSYGPFVEKNKRLNLFLVKDSAKGATISRSKKRKEELNELMVARRNDNENTRGLTIDQKINLASFQLQKRNQEQMENEQRLVALIANESALMRQVDAAERRAIIRCKEYDPTNRFWKMVDDLMDEQAESTAKLKEFKNSVDTTKDSNVIDLDNLDESVEIEPATKKRKSNVLFDDDNNKEELIDEESDSITRENAGKTSKVSTVN